MRDTRHLIYKERGETPLECVERFRGAGDLPEGKITYAGRLDPAAEGLLIALSGEARFEKEKYLGLPKTYECEILFGIESDTYDLLGIPLWGKAVSVGEIKEKLPKVREIILDTRELAYPPYSSKTVGGKPMWLHTREATDTKAPTRSVEIFSCEVLKVDPISDRELLNEVEELVLKIKGDFRQEEILQSWRKLKSEEMYPYISLTIECSSGTYIRSLAHMVGEKLGTGALAKRIFRSRVGDYRAEEAKRLESLL